MNSIKKIGLGVYHAAIIVVFWFAAVYGSLYHHQFAWNVFVFVLWLTLAFIVLIGLVVNSDSEKVKKAINNGEFDALKPKLPARLLATSDLIGALFLAGIGHWGLAIITLITMGFEQGYYSTLCKEPKTENAASPVASD